MNYQLEMGFERCSGHVASFSTITIQLQLGQLENSNWKDVSKFFGGPRIQL